MERKYVTTDTFETFMYKHKIMHNTSEITGSETDPITTFYHVLSSHHAKKCANGDENYQRNQVKYD